MRSPFSWILCFAAVALAGAGIAAVVVAVLLIAAVLLELLIAAGNIAQHREIS